MLSRQGFLDLGAIEYLRDPSRGHEYIKSISRTFGIWTELGNIPRTILPEASIPKHLLAKKLESEPGNAIPKVLLAEKLVQEEEKTKEMDGKGGYESEELRAGSRGPSPSMQPPRINPVLTQMKGGEAKVESLVKEEKFQEADDFAETRQELVSDDDEEEVREQEKDKVTVVNEVSVGEEQAKQAKHGKLAASMADNLNVEKEEIAADKSKGKETAAPFADLYKDD